MALSCRDTQGSKWLERVTFEEALQIAWGTRHHFYLVLAMKDFKRNIQLCYEKNQSYLSELQPV
jgi:hypothetical protein